MSKTWRIRNRPALIAAGLPAVPREELGPVVTRVLSHKQRQEFFDRLDRGERATVPPINARQDWTRITAHLSELLGEDVQ